MKAEQIKLDHTVEGVLASRGIQLVKGVCKCPFHPDDNPSFGVKEGRWKCFTGCGSGDVIDLLAKFQGKTAAQYLRDLPRSEKAALPPRAAAMPVRVKTPEPEQNAPEAAPAPKSPRGPEVARYDYEDANGMPVFQVVRFEPGANGRKKDFLQRKCTAYGHVWSMDGVERVLYRASKLRAAQTVWMVEGEKDVQTLEDCGFVATTSAGGSQGWLASYADSLKGKDLILCGDNDDAGRKYMKDVEDSCSPVARSIRRVEVPAFAKDISEYLASLTPDEDATAILNAMVAQTEPLYQGEPLPLLTMEEMEVRYIEFLKSSKEKALKLSSWLPSLSMVLVPGELLFILADTGVGKTAILGNLIVANPHLASVLFELELAESRIFQRMAQKAAEVSRYQIESAYATGGCVPWRESHKLDRLVVSPESFQTIERMESIVRRSELKTGHPPALVFVDYIQLVGAKERDRRSRVAEIAEGLKKMAKSRNVVVVCTSQVSRDKERGYGEIGMHDGKEAGEIENSAGTVLGVSRNPEREGEMCIQVLKSTEHGGGKKIYANFDFKTLLITEKLLT